MPWVWKWVWRLVGVRWLKVEVSTNVWGKDMDHSAGCRYFRLYVSALVFGRFMDLELRG